MKLKFAKDYTPRAPKGKEVDIDKIRTGISESGLQFRVIGLWEQPQWFDIKWFEGLENVRVIYFNGK